MSEQNVAIYHDMVAAWNDGDVDRLVAFTDPRVEVLSFLATVEGGYQGHEGVRRWWQNFHETFPDWHAEVQDIYATGETTVARLRLRGHGGGSGVPVDQVMWHVVLWRDGKSVRVSAHGDEADALQAAGLSE